MKHFILLLLALNLGVSSCRPVKKVHVLPKLNEVSMRTLFIGLDGVDYELVKELKDEGYFKSFLQPVPLVSTFPSATTIGFTGLFRPLGNGKTHGYETRFFSYKENKVVGGSLKDLYKYDTKYKRYFDSFRHSIQSKMIMYSFPSMASKQDLVNTRKVLLSKDKKVIMAYLGGTDGSAHLLGRNRTKRTLKFMDDFLQKLQIKYLDENEEPLRIVLFSDHGFQYNSLKTVSITEMRHKLAEKGFDFAKKIEDDRDVVLTRFGLLSAGVGFTNLSGREDKALALAEVKGMDLVFWHLDDDRKIYIQNPNGERAYFEYRGKDRYRYVPVTGDPLQYVALLKKHHLKAKQWISDKKWKKISWNHHYPDSGYRLYDSFFDLVKNKASIMFSLKPNYQFGSFAALAGTWTRAGQKGTHGGLFRQTTWAFSMSNIDKHRKPPQFFRYDEFFKYYLPKVSKTIAKEIRKSGHFPFDHNHNHDHNQVSNAITLNDQLYALENLVLGL